MAPKSGAGWAGRGAAAPNSGAGAAAVLAPKSGCAGCCAAEEPKANAGALVAGVDAVDPEAAAPKEKLGL